MVFELSACVVQLSAAFLLLRLHKITLLHKSSSLLGLCWRYDDDLIGLEVCSIFIVILFTLIKKIRLPEICTATTMLLFPLQPYVCRSNCPPEAAVSIAANGETLPSFPSSGKKIRLESTFLLSPKAPLTISHLSQTRSALAERFHATYIYSYIKITPCLPLFASRCYAVLVLTAPSVLCCHCLLQHGLSESGKKKQFFQ